MGNAFKDGLGLSTQVEAKSLTIVVDNLCLCGLAADWSDDFHEYALTKCQIKVAKFCGILCPGLPAGHCRHLVRRRTLVPPSPSLPLVFSLFL